MAAAETQVETKEKTRKVSTTGVSVKKERRKSVILQCAVSGQKEIPTPSPFLRRGSAGLVQLMEVPITKFPDMIHANDEEDEDR